MEIDSGGRLLRIDSPLSCKIMNIARMIIRKMGKSFGMKGSAIAIGICFEVFR